MQKLISLPPTTIVHARPERCQGCDDAWRLPFEPLEPHKVTLIDGQVFVSFYCGNCSEVGQDLARSHDNGFLKCEVIH